MKITQSKISVKGISGLHKLEQSLGLLWLTHGAVILPRQPPSSEGTKVAESLSGSLCSHLYGGRAETSSQDCVQHISFYPVCPYNKLSLTLHRISHCGQTAALSARPFWATENYQTSQRYSAFLGYRWGEMQSQSHGPGGERTVGPFCFKLQAADFQSGKGLQELIRKFKIADFSQNWNTKADIYFESAESLWFSNWDI